MTILRAKGNTPTRGDRGRSPVSRGSSRIRSGRIHKPEARGRGRGAHNTKYFTHARPPNEEPAESASETVTQQSTPLPGLEKHLKVKRITGKLSACTEWSLAFVDQASLESDEDTNTIALNLMDHFVFSADNWLPELSYCKLHAACFLMSSRVTGKQNSVEQIAEALGSKSKFVEVVVEPMDGDDEEVIAMTSDIIGVGIGDVEMGYRLLWERREVLRELMGEYGENVVDLPIPDGVVEDALREMEGEEIDFDVFQD